MQFSEKPEVPSSVKSAHEYLLDKIHQCTLLPDSAGAVAIKLEELIQHHFKEEEDFVLPPLGLLPLLANGKMPDHPEQVIQLTDHLKSQLTHMSVEHQLIKAYINDLKRVSAKQRYPEIFELEKEIHKHANAEEEIFFPAAILAGEYLKLKSQTSE